MVADICLSKLLLLVHWIHQTYLFVLLPSYIPIREREKMVLRWYCDFDRVRHWFWTSNDVCLLAYIR
jgi:hypothetical protein